MNKSQISCQKIDLISTILVICLTSAAVHAQVTLVAITPAASLPSTSEGYEAVPDTPTGNTSSYNNASALEVDTGRASLAKGYTLLTPQVPDSPRGQVNGSGQEVESALVQQPTTITPEPTDVNVQSQQQQQQSQANFSQQQAPASVALQTHCTLGDDTYQIGERWNPNLPPFGVQVCVLCECTVRQRKACYESKVTCRRITNECPVIDSCPDGKKPVTVAGQCCKSCQSTTSATAQPTFAQQQQQEQQQQQQEGGLQEQLQQPHPGASSNQSLAYDSQPLVARSLDRELLQHTSTMGGGQSTAPTSFKIVYMNERIKEYMSLVKNLPACPTRDGDTKPSSSAVSPSTPQPAVGQLGLVAPKMPKGARNDLNGIDLKLAFKSLHDSAPNYLGQPKRGDSQGASQQAPGTRRFDHSAADDQQHPNDVQSASSNSNFPHNNPSIGSGSGSGSGGYRARHHSHHHHQRQQQQHQRHQQSTQQPGSAGNCVLGNDTFQVGDMWNPILPPFGIQVCVQCNCIFRVRKGCYETKVTCRRINRDCPVIEVCPDGKPPVNVEGQCCKTCPDSLASDDSTEDDNTGEQPAPDITSNATTQSSTPNTMPLDGIQRNEKVARDFQALSRNLNVCLKLRESVDIYNTNRYARRSRQA